MITLKQISERISSILNQSNNFELKERIKDSFKSVLATRIRQSVSSNGIDELMKLSYTVEFEKYDRIVNEIYKVTDSSVNIKDNVFKLRSINKVLSPIRFNNDGLFTKVYADTLLIGYSNPNEMLFERSPFKDGLWYYMENGYAIIVSTDEQKLPKLRYISFETIFEDPEKVLAYYEATIFDEDISLPFPIDMIETIIAEILKTEFMILPTEDKQVEISK